MIAYEEEPNYRNDAQQIVWDRPSRKAILLGSRARGTEQEGSDWDILVLLDKPKVTLQDYDKSSYPLRELGWDIDETINHAKTQKGRDALIAFSYEAAPEWKPQPFK